MVTLPDRDSIRAVIYAKPESKSDTVAVVSGWDYILFPEGQTLRAFLVTFHYDDYFGLPILSINHDSSWARVSIQSEDFSVRSEGWVRLRNFKESVRIWATYLLTEPIVLRDNHHPQFYSKPNKNARWNIKVFRFHSMDEYSYVLHPIRREGRWLLVGLETPIDPCGGTPESIKQEFGVSQRKLQVWIEYLDDRMRPLVKSPVIC